MSRTVRRRSATVCVAAAALAMLVSPVTRAANDAAPAAPPEPTMGPLISGTTSVVEGTHVWTDYAYDDRGADASSAPTYPAEAAPGNAADLIQLQLRPGAGGIEIRAVLETLTDASVPSVGIGIDTDDQPGTGATTVPGGQWTVAPDGAQLGLERFVVIDHTGARVLAWDGRAWAADPVGTVPATIDVEANTVAASIPNGLLGAGESRWRVVGVLGLALPGHSWVDGDGPIYDLAYVHDPSASGQTFQSEVQAGVLSGTDDAGKAVAALDVAALRKGGTTLARPIAGVKNTFLYRSTLRLGEGISSVADRKHAGPYQPYVAWFPEGLPERPPLVVFLHGASSTHLDGSYGGSGSFVPLEGIDVGPGQIAPDALVITPLGRGETALGYAGPSEQDILDAIADASRRFDVDADRVVLTGYSLGGVGTFNLSQHYPDRWAGAVEIVGAHDLGPLTLVEEAGGTQTMPNALENLRNLPFRMAHARLDELELVIGDQPDLAWLAMQQLGYDFRYYQFQLREHLTFPVETIQCELEAAIERGRVHDPAQVVYSQEPAIVTRDQAIGLELHHDRAYWLSDMVVRDDGAPGFAPGEKGTVDVTDLTRADRSPTSTAVNEVNENITAGRDVCGSNPDVQTNDVWTTQGNAWSRGPDQVTTNGLRVVLTRTASVRVDLARMAGIDVARTLKLELTSDGDSLLRLAGPWRGAATVNRAGAPPHQLCPRDGVLDLTTAAGSSTVWLTPTHRRCT